MAGLKLRYQTGGNYTQDFTASQYTSLLSNYGTRRVCIRTKAGNATSDVVKYGLTTLTSASQYCRFRLRINNQNCYLGEISTIEENYTRFRASYDWISFNIYYQRHAIIYSTVRNTSEDGYVYFGFKAKKNNSKTTTYYCGTDISAIIITGRFVEALSVMNSLEFYSSNANHQALYIDICNSNYVNTKLKYFYKIYDFTSNCENQILTFTNINLNDLKTGTLTISTRVDEIGKLATDISCTFNNRYRTATFTNDNDVWDITSYKQYTTTDNIFIRPYSQRVWIRSTVNNNINQ